MSDVATASTGYSASRGEVNPARRVTPPRWRDTRLMIGILLLLASVVLGARVVGAADHTVPLLTASTDLPAGHIIAPGDLGQVRARIVAPAGVYLAADQAGELSGRRLSRPIGRGELITNSALAGPVDVAVMRDVPIVIDSLRLPRLHAGDLVDVIATTKPRSIEMPVTRTVVSMVEVIGDPAGREGSGGKMRLVLRIPATMVLAVVRASELGDIDVVAYLGNARA